MTILQIEHPVRDFDRWKQAFDGDPVGRKEGGVRRYRIYRSADDPNYVVVDLELDSPAEAEAFLGRLRVLWSRAVEQGLIRDPQARILEVAETVDV
jgi:ribosomal protein L35AE/L33A